MLDIVSGWLNFEQLFVLRALHGLGFGGEWAAGAVLMGEVIRDKYRGRGVGLVQTGWARIGPAMSDQRSSAPFDHSVYRARNVLPWRPKAADKGADTGNWRILGPAASETMGTYSACFWISSVRRHRVRDKRGPPKIGHAHNTRDGLDH